MTTEEMTNEAYRRNGTTTDEAIMLGNRTRRHWRNLFGIASTCLLGACTTFNPLGSASGDFADRNRRPDLIRISSNFLFEQEVRDMCGSPIGPHCGETARNPHSVLAAASKKRVPQRVLWAIRTRAIKSIDSDGDSSICILSNEESAGGNMWNIVFKANKGDLGDCRLKDLLRKIEPRVEFNVGGERYEFWYQNILEGHDTLGKETASFHCFGSDRVNIKPINVAFQCSSRSPEYIISAP